VQRILTIGVLLLIFFNQALSQKKKTVLGNMCRGFVVSTNETNREIKLEYKEGDKTESFVGVLKEGVKETLKDGSLRPFSFSMIPVGARVRVFYNTKDEMVNGDKVKVNKISRLDLLGKDEYSALRETIKVDPSAKVILSETGKLPSANPLKLFIAVGHDRIRNHLINWVAGWNKDSASKFGSLEIVSTPAAADLCLVILEGSEHILVPFVMTDGEGDDHIFPLVSLYLVGKKDGEVEILWKQGFLIRQDEEDEAAPTRKDRIEKELEKRLKARLKY